MRQTLLTFSLFAFTACGVSSLFHTDSQTAPEENNLLSDVKEAANTGRIQNLLLRPTQAAPGLPSRHFREGTREVFCTFDVRGVAIGTAVTVHWLLNRQELARNDLAIEQHTRSLSAVLSSDDALTPGRYEVEVRVAGTREARTTFTILGEAVAAPEASNDGSTEPAISGVTLSTSAECTPGSGGSTARWQSYQRGVHRIQLCLRYVNMPRGRRLMVRWYSVNEDAPLSTNSFQVDGDGDLMASFNREPEILPGSYRATVSLEGQDLGRASFVIRR